MWHTNISILDYSDPRRSPPSDRSQKYLEKITNSGYFKDFKSDINGNLFGLLVKEDPTYTISQQNQEDVIYYQVLNGYVFYDRLYSEGYNFNFNTEDDVTYEQTIRSGLSGGNFGSFLSFSEEKILDFGTFDFFNFIDASEDNLTNNYFIIDGITLTLNSNAYVTAEDGGQISLINSAFLDPGEQISANNGNISFNKFFSDDTS